MRGTLFRSWKLLLYSWTINHIIRWLVYLIQSPIPIVQRFLGRQGGQGGGSFAASSTDLSPFTGLHYATTFNLAGGGYGISLILFFYWCLALFLSQGCQSMIPPLSFSHLLMLLSLNCVMLGHSMQLRREWLHVSMGAQSVATSILASAVDVAFCWVETMANLLLTG